MAIIEHLAKLLKGVDAWNEWREKNPDIQPDLSRADLIWAHLRGAILSRANLSRAHLNMADLREAKLYKAHLSGADLNGADLREADLGGANLLGADLRGANLEEVENLTQQQLDEAKTDEKTILPDYLRNK